MVASHEYPVSEKRKHTAYANYDSHRYRRAVMENADHHRGDSTQQETACSHDCRVTPKGGLVAALDIGSTKISCLIAEAVPAVSPNGLSMPALQLAPMMPRDPMNTTRPG